MEIIRKLIRKRFENSNFGIYFIRLEMYMLTKRDKTSKKKEEIHRLSKKKTAEIHQAEHIKSSAGKHLKPTRLLCVPKINNQLCWPSFGLSNFIQPPR